jgi:hypothetical protein
VLAVTSAVTKGFTGIAFKLFPAAFRAGSVAPDDAARVSRKRYMMEGNEDAVRNIQLDFAEDRCRFTRTSCTTSTSRTSCASSPAGSGAARIRS